VVERVKWQEAAYDRLAEKYGLTSAKERLVGPARYRWDLIERDIHVLLNRRTDLPAGSKDTYPEPLVNYLAVTYLACCVVESRAPSQELVHLIWRQLDLMHFGMKGGKPDALQMARQIRNAEPGISNRMLARRVRVDTSTVGRWVNRGRLPPVSQ
jgi:hypothetical protein